MAFVAEPLIPAIEFFEMWGLCIDLFGGRISLHVVTVSGRKAQETKRLVGGRVSEENIFGRSLIRQEVVGPRRHIFQLVRQLEKLQACGGERTGNGFNCISARRRELLQIVTSLRYA